MKNALLEIFVIFVAHPIISEAEYYIKDFGDLMGVELAIWTINTIGNVNLGNLCRKEIIDLLKNRWIKPSLLAELFLI